MQLLAMLSMLVDHVGLILLHNNPVFRVIGRLAFPLYLFGIVQGWQLTRNQGQYFKRLAVIALAAQIPFSLAFHTLHINVVASFLVILSCFWFLDHSKTILQAVSAVTVAAIILQVLSFDYGSYGLFLALSYRYLNGLKLIGSHFILNVIYLFLLGWLLQPFSILSTMLIVHFPQLAKRMQLPRWLWRSFYPAHLLALYLIFVYTQSTAARFLA